MDGHICSIEALHDVWYPKYGGLLKCIQKKYMITAPTLLITASGINNDHALNPMNEPLIILQCQDFSLSSQLSIFIKGLVFWGLNYFLLGGGDSL